MRTIRRTMITVAAALLLAGSAFAAPRPIGQEMTLYAGAHDRVHRPAVAVDAAGTLWTVWQSDEDGIVGRRFARDFTPTDRAAGLAGNDLPAQVPYRGPAMTREAPVVVPLADGRLFVAWREQSLDLNVDIFYEHSEVVSTTLAGQLFGPSGQPASRRFVIAEQAGDTLGQPTALEIAPRRIVVAWSAEDASGAARGLEARVIQPNGRALSDTFELGDRSAGMRPALALAPEGGFLAVWQEEGAGVFARTFDGDGTPRGSAVTVRSGAASLPAVARGADGGYLVAWSGPVDTSEPGLGKLETRIYGRHLDGAGLPDGSAVGLSTGGGIFHGSPAVAAGADGYLAAWSVWNRSAPLAVRALSIDLAGRPETDSVRLNQSSINYMWSLGITTGADGSFLVAWEGFDAAGHSAVNARQVAVAGAAQAE